MSKRKKALFLPVLLVGLGLFGFSIIARIDAPENSNKNIIKKELIFTALDRIHYNTIDVNDEFSENAFNQYLKILDPNKRYFLKADINKFNKSKDKLDDEIKTGVNTDLYELSVRIFDERRQEVEKMTEEILAKPFDFTKKETILFDSDEMKFPKNDKERYDRWRKTLKYAALLRMNSKLKAEEAKKKTAEEKGEEFTPTSYEDMEKDVREKVLANYKDVFDYMRKQDEDDHYANYLNSMISIYGPHTEYFAPEKKEQFDTEISGHFEGIGARLQQTGGEVKVVSIIAGSASWKQGDLEANDIILKVAQGEEEPVDIGGMSLKNSIKLIKGPKGTEVRLTVRKADGRITVIPIIRDVVIIEESYAKSAVIIDENSGKKIGLIDLPSFYVDFNDRNGRNCGNDIKQEIIKLKNQGVDGIVFDLRNNGGGSLGDAVQIVGHFVGKSPVVQVKSKGAGQKTLKPEDNNILYDGPLVVMINRMSASASEIVSAALQDHGRAVVLGSRSFGKGTVQRFIDLDRMTRSEELKPLGSLKLTIQKFYRINGEATQVDGVTPDILLPDTYGYLKVGEEDLPFVLPHDSIEKAKYNMWAEQLPLADLNAKSKERVANDKVFKIIEDNALRLKRQEEKKYFTLNLDEFRAEQEKLDEESKKLREAETVHEEFDITVMKDHYPTSKPDSVIQQSEDKWKEVIKKDAYIKEATMIISDMMIQ
ncbi:carboxy terminal-processing peptidase [Flammeovirga yaeyamensis]|uniref:Carboxy terminal-processing peptidase n=1 Tax=Flammeovirga yaeyamensis TaxID=367791 RepID=A0AAX1N8N0_9BACT|nr:MULTISPECIES: carboxy terminal-processing peptidase [Flammeovirga]ANQ48629.1 carboxy terminal-processing peptidase [Flammeovirga sp. MY04]MBB3698713.1 carboxyl-terminal processing protease [Flammeovirga yaeyamensis]NMF37299.1 carboxy terminal-processing peptidase [Flammeovirga yaeyamensis]QWG03883.1 carboxy terminal-processing peptidase [Flammeovirga yaeyamensis]